MVCSCKIKNLQPYLFHFVEMGLKRNRCRTAEDVVQAMVYQPSQMIIKVIMVFLYIINICRLRLDFIKVHCTGVTYCFSLHENNDGNDTKNKKKKKEIQGFSSI